MRSLGGHLTVLHALSAATATAEMAAAGVGSWCSESFREAGAAILDRAVADVALEADRVSTELSDETPARAIIATATVRAASLIVMATHGRGGFRRTVLG